MLFWMFERNASLREFFRVPTTYALVDNIKRIFFSFLEANRKRSIILFVCLVGH